MASETPGGLNPQVPLAKPFEVESSCESDSLLQDDATRLTTVAEVIDYGGFGKFQWLLMFYTGAAWVADAMEVMLLSYLQPAAKCAFNLTSAQESMISSVVFLGIMLGAWGWGPVSDWLGRKKGFLVTGLFTCIFAVASAMAPNYTCLLIFRGLVGFGLGGVPVIFSLFLEFVPTASRGRALVAIQSFWTLGTLAETALIAATLPTLGWRWMVGLSSIPFCCLMLFYPLVPESPHWLASVKGDQEAAEKVLKHVMRINKKTTPRILLQRRDGSEGKKDEEDGLLVEKSKASFSLKQLSTIFLPPLLLATLCLLVIWFANSVVYYGLVLLTTKLSSEGSGGGGTECVDSRPVIPGSSYLEVFIVSTAEFPGLLLAAGLVDTIGRKHSLGGGLLLCGCALMILALQPPYWLSMACLWVSRALVMGTFTVAWILTPEVYPTVVRASGTGLCNGFARIGGMVAPLLSNTLVDMGLVRVTEVIFGALALMAAAASWLVPVETKGRAL